MAQFTLILLITALAHYGHGLSTSAEKSAAQENKPLEWWQQSVIYQIYPRSFQDSDGDGVGDINGITSKLDYFVDLGIDAIWISPMYESPMKDFGYDISNFTNIDPIFGTLDDFKVMAAEFKKRGLKLIMDMVPNHSSDQHPWFKKSVQRIEPYTDYYVWKDAKGFDENGKPIPPTNWVAAFAGSSWEWNEQRQQFYLHQFVIEQPDLNFENIDVRNEVLAVFKFWLDAGVDGFRVDAVPMIYEDQRFLDEPEDPNRDPEAKPDEYKYWNHIYTYNLPQVTEFLADVRQLLDVYTKSDGRVRCMMVEAGVPPEAVKDYYGTPDKPVAHFPFNFNLLDVTPQQNASEVLSRINAWYDVVPEGNWATFLIGNHDQKRAPTRWTEGSIDGANMINLLLQGTAVTYYGEEIGMTDLFLTWEETVDPAGCNTDPERYEKFSRDPARTPMQWNKEIGSGFSSSNTTWLPINPNQDIINVAAEEAAEESHLKVYKELLKLRQTDAWRYGAYQSMSLNSDKVLAFARMPAEGSSEPGYVVLVNLSEDPVTVNASVFSGVPIVGWPVIRSVGYHDSRVVVGGVIYTPEIPMGTRDSVVIQFYLPEQ
jgi:glycosidase